jgi:nucleoside-diphosphate-sugar epimerase
VKRVVITSSFAAIVDRDIGNDPSKTYSEADWNPITEQQAQENASEGYRASKTFAEKAAWKFVEEEKPNFDVATVNPPLVFGPVKKETSSLKQVNTSNERVLELIQGKYKDGFGQTSVFLWVDVRVSHPLLVPLLILIGGLECRPSPCRSCRSPRSWRKALLPRCWQIQQPRSR